MANQADTFAMNLFQRAHNKAMLALYELAIDDRRRLKHFSITALIFFTSYGMIYHANRNLPPSFEQELTAFSALVCCILSLVWAVGLQLLFILKNTGLIKNKQ